MALVKYGGGITQMSGSIAGNVFARNRFGNYVRPRTKPVNPRSTRQEEIRSIVSYLAEYWHETVTLAQRQAWDLYAANVAMKNKLGETVYMTGFNHFIRLNSLLLLIGGAINAVAPSTFSLADKDPTLICSEESIADQTFTFTYNGTGWGLGDDLKNHMFFFQGQPAIVTRNFFIGPWRLLGACNEVSGALGTITIGAGFPIAVGQKVWFKARIHTVTGRVSEAWLTDPRTIVAD